MWLNLRSPFVERHGSYPIWEDFINKAGKLQSQLRTTVVAAAAFLDAFQKVADMATNTRVYINSNRLTYFPSFFGSLGFFEKVISRKEDSIHVVRDS
ncbi:hypothetical protein L345_06358, partial [Ophiophagus hannah]